MLEVRQEHVCGPKWTHFTSENLRLSQAETMERMRLDDFEPCAFNPSELRFIDRVTFNSIRVMMFHDPDDRAYWDRAVTPAERTYIIETILKYPTLRAVVAGPVKLVESIYKPGCIPPQIEEKMMRRSRAVSFFSVVGVVSC